MSFLEEDDINNWVRKADDKENREFREAVHTILSAISFDESLKANMILKGGILLAIRYQSHRYTKDIDFSTEQSLQDLDPDEILEKLNGSLALMVENLNYGLDCVIQSLKIMPKKDKPSFPSINLKIGYAYKGSDKHRRLQALQSPTVISIDYSLNEHTPNVDSFQLTADENILVYSLTDLIAEKIRSLLQQELRNRNRRQDIFDLYLILENTVVMDEIEIAEVYISLVEKSRSRNIETEYSSFDSDELRRRAQAEYETLSDEIEGELPDFNAAFEVVQKFYKSLPWNIKVEVV